MLKVLDMKGTFKVSSRLKKKNEAQRKDLPKVIQLVSGSAGARCGHLTLVPVGFQLYCTQYP